MNWKIYIGGAGKWQFCYSAVKSWETVGFEVHLAGQMVSFCDTSCHIPDVEVNWLKVDWFKAGLDPTISSKSNKFRHDNSLKKDKAIVFVLTC